MFTHVVEALPSEIAEDILEHPPTEKQIDVLKEAILSRMERSDNAKLRDLLNNVRQNPFSTSAFNEKSSGTHG